MRKPHVIVIVGPTASGKSAYAVRLAKKIDGEIISADSRQVYRGLNLGTGKITKKEMKGVQHHLLDVISPKKRFSADDFVLQGKKAIAIIISRGKTPIIVGGTGFYIDTLLGRIALPSVPPNLSLRKGLEKRSVSELYSVLQKKDPVRAKTIEPHHKRRLIRALEVVTALGSVPKPKVSSPYEIKWIGLRPDQQTLEKKIERRLQARVNAGMIREAKRLHTQGLSYKRMHELGLEYRSLARLLEKKITQEEMMFELKRDIRRYAKKQMAYWKRNKAIRWKKI